MTNLSVAALRALSIDTVQKANSGHPGLPLGASPMAYALWNNVLNVNPKTDRNWFNRDRFVLAAGHGSAMLYSLLHLAGYDVAIEDLQNFRQWNSITPGHPEVTHTSGIEATSGPLGQGLGQVVGLAMAETHLAAKFNKAGHEIIDHYTYTICGDGDLMEGISQEALSLAGHLKLNKLVVLYDSNGITLDGTLDMSSSDDVKKRMESLNWEHILVEDGNDVAAITKAIEAAKTSDKPSLIEIKTVIGFGSPNAGSNKSHGAPFGEEGNATTKANLGFNHPPFTVPQEVYDDFENGIIKRGELAENAWNEKYAAYKAAYPELAKELEDALNNKLPELELPKYEVGTSEASRITNKIAIQELAKQVPYLWGGSADLASSNNTMIADSSNYSAENYGGRNIWYGIREFAMAAVMNGIALHGGTRVFGATFFVFSDYLKAAIRMSAIQKLPVIYVLTHDSIAVGEDGATHEPIEQLAGLRAIPNVQVLRPADGNETMEAWKKALHTLDKPTILVLTRQNLPVLEGTDGKAKAGIEHGGYVLADTPTGKLDGILIGSGSEVSLCVDAQAQLKEKGYGVRVVSVPSLETFLREDKEYIESVLPKSTRARIAVEAASPLGWGALTGLDGDIVAIDKFGASAPGNILFEKYGFTAENITSKFLNIL
ncbi:MAG: transketolase [Lactobacillales bacterium]|jgi:transketolase|nr:transketolase [Lactobacillales bacterium]